MIHVGCLFFFTSRRRHTRYIGDWSSDVCSSDLLAGLGKIDRASYRMHRGFLARLAGKRTGACRVFRSEERRVEKEWRYKSVSDSFNIDMYYYTNSVN